MQLYKRSILTIAAIIGCAVASHAASTVSIDLTGEALKSGSNIELSSTEALSPASIYYYSVSGSLSTTGTTATALDFQDVLSGSIGTTGTGTGTLAGLVATVDPKLSPYLSGTVPDITGTFPFTVVNVLESGTFPVTSGTVTSVVHATLKIKVSVDKTTGTVVAKISNVDFGIKFPKKGTVKDKLDSFVFEGGSIVVSSSFATPLADPDLSFDFPAPVGLLGVTSTTGTTQYAYTLKKGKSASTIVYLENSGTAPSSYVLTVSGTTPDYDNKFIYKGTNITKLVTGTSGYTLPPEKKIDKVLTAQPLGVDDAKTLTWIVKFTGTTPGTSSPVLTGSSTAAGTVNAAQLVVTGSVP
jgi:hypothetical protein